MRREQDPAFIHSKLSKVLRKQMQTTLEPNQTMQLFSFDRTKRVAEFSNTLDAGSILSSKAGASVDHEE